MHWMGSGHARAYHLRKKPQKPTNRSIFQQLFPDATLSKDRTRKPTLLRSSHLNENKADYEAAPLFQGTSASLDKLPPLGAEHPMRQPPAMIVVKNGNKNTLPSDFYRAFRGNHFEGRGWSMMKGEHIHVTHPTRCSV